MSNNVESPEGTNTGGSGQDAIEDVFDDKSVEEVIEDGGLEELSQHDQIEAWQFISLNKDGRGIAIQSSLTEEELTQLALFAVSNFAGLSVREDQKFVEDIFMKYAELKQEAEA